MALRGDLASVDLAQVFQMLALNKKVGLLSIQSPRLWKVLYFDHRGVTLYYNPHTVLDRAVATFVRVGRIQAAAVEEMREHASRNRLELIDALLAGGYLTEAELTAQMRYEVEEEVYELFFCKDARFEFLEGIDTMPEREGVVDDRFFFNTESVIMEAARRIDEWSYIAERISNGLEVFCRTGKRPDHQDLGEECAIVYDCVDGRRNVSRIVEVSGLSSFAVFKNLSQLLDGSFVEQLPAAELIRIGQSCVREGRPQDAINLFEKAIELGVGVPEVHSMAAQAYEGTHEYENAIYHLKCDAEYRIAAGDVRGAAQRLLAAGRLVPTDLAARERLVEIALTQDVRLSEFDPVEEGKELVNLLMGAGDLRRVRSILERLLTVRPDDLDLKKVLVSVHTKAGDQARVIELYESISSTLVKQHRPIEAIAYLQKILMLDRTRSDISEKVRSLYAQDERARTRRRAMATLGVICVLLVAVGFAYNYYDQAATSAFESIDVQQYLADEEFGLAAAAYEQFLGEYPLASAGARAREELLRIDQLRLKQEAAQHNREVARQREVERLRLDYLGEWRRHRQLFLEGRPEAALASIERVRQLVREAGLPEDQDWAREEQVESNYVKIRDFVEASIALEQRGREELAAGRYRNAWALAVDLVTNYDITEAARRARIPVWVQTRPQGAQILLGGQHVMQDADGVLKPLSTPTVLLCGRDPAVYDLVLEGFQPAKVTIDPRQHPEVDLTLAVIAARRIDFDEQVQTAVAADGDWIAAGLRNGKLAVASARTGSVRQVVVLGGLKAVDGTPVVAGDRVWFCTNEATLECYRLDIGRPAAGWPRQLISPAQTEMVVRDGRLLFVDRNNVLRCFDQGNGRELWAQELGAAPSGVPSVEQRRVRAGVTDGRIVLVDVVDGSLPAVLRCPAPISTRVFFHDGRLFFGCADGMVRAVDESNGRISWSTPIGRAPVDGEVVGAHTGLIACGPERRLLLLDHATGKVVHSLELAGDVRPTLRVDGERLLMTLRMERTESQPAHELLQCRSIVDLSLLWEYQDPGTFTGAPSVGGTHVAVSGAKGDVVLFR